MGPLLSTLRTAPALHGFSPFSLRDGDLQIMCGMAADARDMTARCQTCGDRYAPAIMIRVWEHPILQTLEEAVARERPITPTSLHISADRLPSSEATATESVEEEASDSLRHRSLVDHDSEARLSSHSLDASAASPSRLEQTRDSDSLAEGSSAGAAPSVPGDGTEPCGAGAGVGAGAGATVRDHPRLGLARTGSRLQLGEDAALLAKKQKAKQHQHPPEVTHGGDGADGGSGQLDSLVRSKQQDAAETPRSIRKLRREAPVPPLRVPPRSPRSVSSPTPPSVPQRNVRGTDTVVQVPYVVCRLTQWCSHHKRTAS